MQQNRELRTDLCIYGNLIYANVDIIDHIIKNMLLNLFLNKLS